MTDESPDLYSTFIDYRQTENWDTRTVNDGNVIRRIAAENFEMEKRRLGEVMQDQLFNIPEYQRVYSWKTKHHRQFWSDIEQFIQASLEPGDDNVSDVFFSSMYFAVDPESESYDVIDGQQRLTTTHILLRVIEEHLAELDSENIEDDALRNLWEIGQQSIHQLLYRHEPFSGESPRLTLNKHDEAFFEALISDDEARVAYICDDDRDYSIHGNNSNAIQVSDCLDQLGIDDDDLESLDTSDLRFSAFFKVNNSHQKLLDAYEFYRKQISTVVDDAEDSSDAARALLNISHYVQYSYHVGEFVIREAEPDFRMQIFEILNDRGVELTKIDRIRAAVVNAFYDTEHQSEYVGKWEDIVEAFATDDDQIDEFLSIYLSIVDEGVDTIGDASSELTNAFDTRAIDPKVHPRLGDLEEAKEFIDYAHELVGYYQDITDPNLEAKDLKLADYREQCQEVLVRLNDQQMDQWRPFVLALYHHTDPDSRADAADFYDLLDTIEKLNFRRLLASERPNVFQEVFIDAVHEFGLAPGTNEPPSDPYTPSKQYLIEQLRSSAPRLFGDRFVDIITQMPSWSTKSAKLLFGKIAHHQFREEDDVLERRLNMSSIHLEHILPQTPIDDPEDPVWLRNFFRLELADTELATDIETYIDFAQRETLDEEEERLKDNISEFITQRFIDDIGNFLLLRDSDNIRASNRPLAEKLPQYYRNVDGFTSIHPNRYFTPDEGPIDRDRLDELLEQHQQVADEEREAIDEELLEEFNSLWTYETLQERRVDLLLDVLDILQFDVMSDEFGLESDEDAVSEEIRRKSEEEFEKRLSARPM